MQPPRSVDREREPPRRYDARVSTNGAGRRESDEALYDSYLDAALSGRLEDPAAFLARHPDAGAALRARLSGLHRMIADQPAGSHSPLPDTPEPQEGLPFERLGEFKVLRHLDAGGMGSVYLARDERLGRLVALKVVRPELRASRITAARFEREAMAVARLSHPNIVNLYSVGEQDGVAFLAMEFAPGQTLDEVIAGDETPAVARVIEWGIALADGLACAHRGGIVHRDVKPSNVLIRPDGRPLLLDFGIAQDAETDALTPSGPFVGSPLYAAPEQVDTRGREIDARTDVYGLGATLYECVTGVPPVEPGTVERVFHRILTVDPAPPRRHRSEMPRDLEVILLTALAKEPARRYDSASALADDLRALREFRPIAARPPSTPEKMWKWARRHPAQSATLATLAVAASAGGMWLIADAGARARQRRADAVALVADARADVVAYARAEDAVRPARMTVRRLEKRLRDSYMTPERVAELDTSVALLARHDREQAAMYHGVLEALRLAERLDPTAARVSEAKAELYAARSQIAESRGDTQTAALFRDLVVSTAPGGAASTRVVASAVLRVATDPSTARIWLYRYVEEVELSLTGTRRLVPVAARHRESPITPGQIVARVTAPAGNLRVGDLVLAVDGIDIEELSTADLRRHTAAGATASAVRADAAFTTPLAPGVGLRRTATPLATGTNRAAATNTGLMAGLYLVVARAAGCAETRRLVRLESGSVVNIELSLWPGVGAPAEFVALPLEDGAPTWMLDREITCAEYLEFLNDPQTTRRIDSSEEPSHFPRDAANARDGGHWNRGEDGRFRIAADWDSQWPVIGISWHDAAAYARWRGPGFSLPTFAHWKAACGAPRLTKYVFGHVFRPGWAKSCFSRPEASPEPVLSYPVDESPLGIFDLAGSVGEWSADWYDEDATHRRVTGGNWAIATPESFRIWNDSYSAPDLCSTQIGFRLVWSPVEGAR